MKSIYGILCALFIGIAQAQQPPLALAPEKPAEFYFNKPVPSLKMLTAAQLAKELEEARWALYYRRDSAARAALYEVEEKVASFKKDKERRLIDFLGGCETRGERIEEAFCKNDRELLKFAIASAKVDAHYFGEVANTAIEHHKKPADSDDKLTLVEELLVRAHNIPQDRRDELPYWADLSGKGYLMPLLLYGGIITTNDGKQYPVEGGARGTFVDKWPTGSLHKIIATGNVDGKSVADLDYLQHRTLKLNERNVWWKDLEEKTLQEVQKAFDAGADVNQLDSDKRSPLHVAAQYSTPAIVKRLLAYGAQRDAKDNHGWTPLHWAAASDKTEVIRVLLEDGTPVDAKDICDHTPLHWAAENGQTETVGVLLEKGAPIDATNVFGRTPLYLAAAGKGQPGAVRLLLEKGANPFICDCGGDDARRYSKNEEIRTLLKEAMKRGYEKYTEKAEDKV